MDVDWNFMLYLRQRYDNHVDVQEVMRSCQVVELFSILILTTQLRQSIDPKLPEGWRVKNINGVEYFKVVVSELEFKFAASTSTPHRMKKALMCSTQGVWLSRTSGGNTFDNFVSFRNTLSPGKEKQGWPTRT